MRTRTIQHVLTQDISARTCICSARPKGWRLLRGDLLTHRPCRKRWIYVRIRESFWRKRWVILTSKKQLYVFYLSPKSSACFFLIRPGKENTGLKNKPHYTRSLVQFLNRPHLFFTRLSDWFHHFKNNKAKQYRGMRFYKSVIKDIEIIRFGRWYNYRFADCIRS